MAIKTSDDGKQVIELTTDSARTLLRMTRLQHSMSPNSPNAEAMNELAGQLESDPAPVSQVIDHSTSQVQEREGRIRTALFTTLELTFQAHGVVVPMEITNEAIDAIMKLNVQALPVINFETKVIS